MKVNREELLKVLESVSPGLSTRQTVAQSNCLVFRNGEVITFNDEVACSAESPIEIEGAVRAAPLIQLLSKLTEDMIDITQTEAELSIKGSKRKASIRIENEILLPIGELSLPDTFKPLDPEFSEAVAVVQACASTDESRFNLTCIHIHPDYLEACDRYQVARYAVKTEVSHPMLVRSISLKRMVGFGMVEFAESDAWVHFRNEAGLVISCRRYADDYVDLGSFISREGMVSMTLPGSLEEVVSKAEIFSADNAAGNHVTIDLKKDKLVVEGHGSDGWYKEMKSITYTGKPVRFRIAPKLLLEIVKKSNECGVSDTRLFVDGGKFLYATCTEIVD